MNALPRHVKTRLDKLYSEERVVPPSMKWKTVNLEDYWRIYGESVGNYAEFWAREALELQWSKTWRSVYEGVPPRVRWFVGGELDAYLNVVGKHRNKPWIWNKPALIWEGEEGTSKVVTYSELDQLVNRVASALKSMGVKPGDWIIVYSPPLIESVATMLASIKLGVAFEPVFTGFAQHELAKRIVSRKPLVVFTSDGFYRRGRVVDTLNNTRRALEGLKYKCTTVVYERVGPPSLRDGEVSFSDLVKQGKQAVENYAASSEHPLFGLHSGYLDDFKPVTHPVAGFLVQVYSTSRWIGLRPHDTYFCTVWPGWITGVSYVVFGPLMVGSTAILYDGGPDYPSWDRWWSLIEEYAVTLFLTTSGALRVLSKAGDNYVRMHNMDTLRAILVTAEPLEVNTWWWTYQVVGTGKTPLITSIPEKLTGRIPVVNLYIQSEVGTFLTGNLVNYVFTPIAPGSAGLPIPGFHVEVVDESGNVLTEGLGELAVMKPWPSMPLEYPREFEEKWSRGYYRTGDYCYRSRDGYLYPLGRLDGVFKVSGYRLSPGAIERVLKESLNIEVAVIKCMDETRFEGVVVVYAGEVEHDNVKKVVRAYIGPIAEPSNVVKVPINIVELVKTRRTVLEDCTTVPLEQTFKAIDS